MNFDTTKAMSFDCYGTLVDWEAGILAVLRPWADEVAPGTDDTTLIRLFGQHERDVQAETPGALYPVVLAEVQRRIAASLGVACSEEQAARFGASVPDWPVFPDTVDALAALEKKYRLYILSNVDRGSFAHSLRKLGASFAGIVTAEDVGSYKPDSRNFDAILACVGKDGVAPDELLHVGESLFHDVIPGTRAGLRTAWIDRQIENPDRPRASGTPNAEVAPTVTYGSMAAFAQAATGG